MKFRHNAAVTKQWTAKLSYIAKAVFRIVQNHGVKKEKQRADALASALNDDSPKSVLAERQNAATQNSCSHSRWVVQPEMKLSHSQRCEKNTMKQYCIHQNTAMLTPTYTAYI